MASAPKQFRPPLLSIGNNEGAPLPSSRQPATAAPLCRIELFGGPRLVRPGEVITRFGSQKNASLLAYLAYYLNQMHPKQNLIEMLWSENDYALATKSLSASLNALRRILEDDRAPRGSVIMIERDGVKLNPSSVITDVLEFQGALKRTQQNRDPEERLSALMAAVDCYQARLLPGCGDSWAVREQFRLAESYYGALLNLGAWLQHSGDLTRALDFVWRAVQAEPVREDAYLLLMDLYRNMDQPEMALSRYEDLANILNQEHGATPTPEAQNRAQEIRALIEQRAGVSEAAEVSDPDSAEQSALLVVSEQGAGLLPERRAPLRFVFLYKRGCQESEELIALLEPMLRSRGHSVFFDRRSNFGMEWAREMEGEIIRADGVVPIISPASAGSELFEYQAQLALEAASSHGKPRIAPVKVGYEATLPPSLAALLQPEQAPEWTGEAGEIAFLDELLGSLDRAPRTAPSRAIAEPVTGPVPLPSSYYVVRSVDEAMRSAIARHESIVLLKGPHQSGKSSLLLRGLDQARAAGNHAILTDLAGVSRHRLESCRRLLRELAEQLASSLHLELDFEESKVWNYRQGPSDNLSNFLMRYVLGRLRGQVVWAIDEVDRLFGHSYSSEVFGLIRHWHNERSQDARGPWSRLTIMLAYSTEGQLLIPDVHLSPFNPGVRISLPGFSVEEVADLNRRCGSPLRGAGELAHYFHLLGGQPYLTRAGLHEMVARDLSLGAFAAEASRDEGPFGDHLRCMLLLLAQDVELTRVVRGVLLGRPCSSIDLFHRLRSAGILDGASAAEARIRCQLYNEYLRRHLLGQVEILPA